MLDCKSMSTPMDTNMKLLSNETSKSVDMTQYRQIIESLMYLMNTRSNICFAVNTLSQYLGNPRCVHLIVAKHVMRYLKGTTNLGHYYGRDHDYRLYGYMDSTWAGSAVDMKNTSNGCYGLGSIMISWFSKKHSSVALSTTEAKYIAACFAIGEAIWLQKTDDSTI